MLTNNLYWSKAYQSLNKSAQNLMWCLYAELRFSGSRKKGTFGFTNNGQISFTETEFRKNGLGVSQTYLNARNQLIEKGSDVRILPVAVSYTHLTLPTKA